MTKFISTLKMLSAVFSFKCPKCRKDKIFESPKLFKKIGKVKAKCPHCQTDFSPELGFYYGSMYISYALNVGVFLNYWIVSSLFFSDASISTFLMVFVGIIVLISPYLYHLSKRIWLGFFVRYNP